MDNARNRNPSSNFKNDVITDSRRNKFDTVPMDLQRLANYKILMMVRGGVKKVVLLGGAHHKVAYPPPPVVVKVPLFCEKIFFA